MESSIWSSKMSLGWSIVHIKGWLGLVECPSSVPEDCILTNIAYSDKLLSSAALQLGLHCFPNLSFTSIQFIKGGTNKFDINYLVSFTKHSKIFEETGVRFLSTVKFPVFL